MMHNVHSQLSLRLLCQSVLGDSLESLLDVDSFFGGSLEVWDVALGLAPCHGSFLRDLALDAWLFLEGGSSCATCGKRRKTIAQVGVRRVVTELKGGSTHHPLGLLHIDFVS